MANISVHNAINFSLDSDEYGVLNTAWNILTAIKHEMIDADVSDVDELFGNVENAAWNIEDVIRASGRSVVKY